jgi:hypothetical protein
MISDALESSRPIQRDKETQIKFVISQIRELRDEIMSIETFRTKTKVGFLHCTEKILSQLRKHGLQKYVIRDVKAYTEKAEFLFVQLLK